MKNMKRPVEKKDPYQQLLQKMQLLLSYIGSIEYPPQAKEKKQMQTLIQERYPLLAQVNKRLSYKLKEFCQGVEEGLYHASIDRVRT